ncbi:TEN3-like protein [Mya arenaria]|uniref:TEN3-like protein n=1 Tax=Mya arenaria TaxID=6604 RepID=A0ABY7G8D7_MYAAR|nr:TEN3-like protein [Mya arenaria]
MDASFVILVAFVVASSGFELTSDIGTSCTNSEQCVNGASCVNDKCACPDDHVPHGDNTSCLEKVNSQCEGRDCIAHASCVELDGSRVCECNVGFVRNAAGDQCLAKVGTDCSGGVPCLGDGTCDVTAELCECVAGHSPNSDYSICGVNVQGTCNIDSDCVQYAVCNEGTCACDVGFKGPETCVKIALGDNCTMPNDCKHVKHAVCAEKQCACAATYTQQDNVCSDFA